MSTVVAYLALLIAPDGHVSRVPDLPSVEACVAVVDAYRQEVPYGRGTCVEIPLKQQTRKGKEHD